MGHLDHERQTLWAIVDACTLPTVDRPLRRREWDTLLRSAASVRRTDPTHASFSWRPEPAVAARAADLIVRETQWCSFFTFAVTASRDRLGLDISVPAEHAEVLSALVDQTPAPTDRTRR
jgi:hypothetical protein